MAVRMGDEAILLVSDLPARARVLIDLDEERDVAHLARGEYSTDPVCTHGIDEHRCSQACRETLAKWPVCGACLRARVGGVW